jgi:hypothetical protein
VPTGEGKEGATLISFKNSKYPTIMNPRIPMPHVHVISEKIITDPEYIVECICINTLKKKNTERNEKRVLHLTSTKELLW